MENIPFFISPPYQVVFLGSPVGPLLLLSGALQGIGSELPFALTRYRRFGWGVFAASGALGAGLVFFWTAYRFGWYGQDLLTLRLAVQVLSGIVLGGLLAKVIVRALERTGVLTNFAIGAAADGGSAFPELSPASPGRPPAARSPCPSSRRRIWRSCCPQGPGWGPGAGP